MKLSRVIEFIKTGRPVPLHVIFKLTERGIDFAELERKHG